MQNNNRCAEDMLTFIARQKDSLPDLHFNEQVAVNDFQVDLAGVLLNADQCFCQCDKKNFEKFLRSLDKREQYFVRTGSIGGAGHWQLLHYIPDNGWQLYSTEQNHCMLTHHDSLVHESADKIFGSNPNPDKWGSNQGQSGIYFWEATNDRVIACTNFLCGFRFVEASQGVEACESYGMGCSYEKKVFVINPYLSLSHNKPKALQPGRAPDSPMDTQAQSPVAHNPHQEVDLGIHEKKFQQLCKQLESINQHLNDNQEHNPNYREISKAVIKLNDTLASNSQFFLEPTLQNFQAFHQRCQEQISNVESKAKPHQVHPLIGELFKVLKGLLELIAAIIYIPEYVVQWGTRSGFQHTFFGGSEINTSLKVADFIQQYKDQAQAIEEILNPNQSHQRI